MGLAEGELQLPEDGMPTQQLCHDLERALHKASWTGVEALKVALPPAFLQTIVDGATSILQREAHTCRGVQLCMHSQCLLCRPMHLCF